MPRKRKAKRRCGVCRKVGHNRSVCPKVPRKASKPDAPPVRARASRGATTKYVRFTAERRATFFETLTLCGLVQRASDMCGVNRQWLYELRKNDDEFAADWTDALEQYGDTIDEEIHRRAVEGWEEPVYQGGDLVGVIRKYDSALLMAKARAVRPKLYRQNVKVEADVALHTGVLVVPSVATAADWGKDDGR